MQYNKCYVSDKALVSVIRCILSSIRCIVSSIRCILSSIRCIVFMIRCNMDNRLFYIFNNTGIENEIIYYCGRNIAEDGNSDFALEHSFLPLQFVMARNVNNFCFCFSIAGGQTCQWIYWCRGTDVTTGQLSSNFIL